MRWRKLGKLFEPQQFKLPHGCVDFAQSPQALVLDDRVRIYFSTRHLEPGTGKFLSHIAYVDVSKALDRILGVSEHTVIELGKRGCFDEHGIFPMHVMRHGDAVYGYTSGVNRRASVPVDTAIGLAISRDQGRSFQRLGDGPVLAPSLYEPCIVADPFVRVIGGAFHMWYIFGTGWKQAATDAAPDRLYKIGHAQSPDGIRWTCGDGAQIVESRLGPDECQALPTVIEIDGRHHMWFCYRQTHDFRKNRERGYRIGHAWSDDLNTWVRNDEQLGIDLSEADWDSQMLCYPHVFECEGQVYLLYNGNEFGKYGFGVAVLERDQPKSA